MPSSTQPQVSDFLDDLHPVIYLPPSSQLSNVILFLPGLGDTSANFSGFAKALNLPDTLTITLQPPFALPFPVGPGWHWSDDLQIDTATGTIDPDSVVSKAVNLIADVIREVLIKKHHFTSSRIHLFGWGQGGGVALATGLHESVKSLGALGSIISLGAVLPLSVSHASSTKNRTPALLAGGRAGVLSKDESVKRTKSFFEFVEVRKWKKTEDSMPSNREEILPIMEFLAKVLKSRRGVPDDAVEVG